MASVSSDAARKRRKLNPPDTGPYILRSLVDSVPLASEDGEEDVRINCVEIWNGHLYVGTSAAEILHFVSLPPDPSDESDSGSFILASRLQPNPDQTPIRDPKGVQRIILLPAVNKACVLCNGITTFYSLPELTPAFGNLSVPNCTFIGGLDLNRSRDAADDQRGQVIMIATTLRIQMIRISDEPPRRISRINFPTCLMSVRRDAISCVADGRSYSLVDVEHQQKIPLFPISSLDDVQIDHPGQIEDVSGKGSHTPSGSLSLLPTAGEDRGHGRSSSLGTFIEGFGKRQQSPQPGGLGKRQPSPQPGGRGVSGLKTPDLVPGTRSPAQATSPERKSTPQPPSAARDDSTPSKTLNPVDEDGGQKALPELPKKFITPLKAHIASSSANEFLLTTGTEPAEPGVGMFVNMDGDVVRGTIEFSKYPQTVILDGAGNSNAASPSPDGVEDEGFVLAVIPGDSEGDANPKLEIQRWDLDPGDSRNKKTWLKIPLPERSPPSVGIHNAISPGDLPLHEIGDSLRQVRLNLTGKRPVEPQPSLPDSSDPRTGASMERMRKEKELFEAQDSTDSENGLINSEQIDAEEERNKEEARRLEKWTGRILLWSGDHIWWIVKNPLILQLDAKLQLAQDTENVRLDRTKVVEVFNELRGTNPRTEMEFLGINYIRQKASLLLFVDLLIGPKTNIAEYEGWMRITENALVEGGMDPRVLLLMIPLVRREVIQGLRGIWVPAGLSEVVRSYVLGEDGAGLGRKDNDSHDENLLLMIKRYLTSWRDQKGFGSIADAQSVSKTVDASLLHILLHLDRKSPTGPATPQSLRAELNRVVDYKFGNHDRAVQLLESYQRLYVLSRLYQSRKLAKDVLGTWKRIIDGERDEGGELSAGELEVQIRRYLANLRDRKLIEQYGTWLAARNAKLGIQVFADDQSKVKFDPSDVIAMLKDGAPGAVQEYLEHLVFTKNKSQYADDLIGYYLDTVLHVLESTPSARQSLSQSYTTYRALKPPKPTYLTFITENAPSESWWQSRLRLLQLLGSSRNTSNRTSLSYDIPTVLARIEPFEKELVSESVILDGRQGRHTQALRLLTHGLGDYDTAIRYCLLGGESIFSGPTSGPLLPENVPGVDQQAELFNHLLTEFLSIEDLDDRLERTSELLARFAAWFDIQDVLTRIPEEWSVDVLADFLTRVLRKLTSERHEVEIVKALSGAQNLRVQVEFIDGAEKLGARVVGEGVE